MRKNGEADLSAIEAGGVHVRGVGESIAGGGEHK